MKLVYTIVGLFSLFTLKYSYNYLLQNNNNKIYKRILFSNLSEEKYLIFCKHIYEYSKNCNINKIYQFIINKHNIELPIEKFSYIFNKYQFIFYPIIDNYNLIGYNIEYNIEYNEYNENNINKLLNYVLNNK